MSGGARLGGVSDATRCSRLIGLALALGGAVWVWGGVAGAAVRRRLAADRRRPDARGRWCGCPAVWRDPARGVAAAGPRRSCPGARRLLRRARAAGRRAVGAGLVGAARHAAWADCLRSAEPGAARAGRARRRAARAARPAPRRAGWRSAAAAGGCCTPSSATRWWRSDRRSRASRPGWRCRRCSNGTGRRSPPRSRPTCWRARCARRRALGHGVRVRPVRAVGRADRRPGRRCAGARSWDGALEVAWRLAAAGRARPEGRRGRRLLGDRRRAAPGAAAVRRGADRTPGWTRSCAGPTGRARGSSTRRSRSSPARPATRRELADAHAAYDALRAFESQADRTRSSIEATAQGLLRAYRFARVAALGARRRRSPPTRLLDERATLYLIGDAKASKLLRPIFLALLSEIVDRAYERATLAGGRLELPLLLCLDEAGQRRAAAQPRPRSRRPRPATTSSWSRSSTTSPRRAAATAARPRRSSTATAPGCCCPGSPTSTRCATSRAWPARRRRATRRARPAPGGASRTTGRRRRPLVAPEALRQLPQGHALLLYGRIPPARVTLRMWFADRRLRRLAA